MSSWQDEMDSNSLYEKSREIVLSMLSDELKDLRRRKEKLIEGEKRLKIKEAQMGYVLHEVQHFMSFLDRQIHTQHNDKLPEEFFNSLNYQLFHVRNVIDVSRLLVNPYADETGLSSLQDVFSIVSRICSIYTRGKNSKGVNIILKGKSGKEIRLYPSVKLAITIIIDDAICNSPEEAEMSITFLEVEDKLTMEIISWRQFQDKDGSLSPFIHGFRSNIIWGIEDDEVVLDLFKQIGNSNSIEYSFEKGKEEKEVDGKHYQSSIVRLIFNSEHK